MTLKKNSLSLLLGYLILVLCQQLNFRLIGNNDLLYPLQTIINLAGALVLLFLSKHFNHQNQLEEKAAPVWWQFTAWAGGGALALLLFQKIFLWFEITFLSQPVISENTSQLTAIAAKYPYYLLVIIVTEPIIEELLFRKVLFGNLTFWFKPWQAALFSSLLFSLAHGDGHFLTYSVIGLILCFIYAKTGKLSAAMTSHVLMNLLVLLIN